MRNSHSAPIIYKLFLITPFLTMDQTILEPGSASAEPVAHPYYPLGIAIPTYASNTTPTPELLAYFALATSVILSTTYFITQLARPKLSTDRIALTMWFSLCGFIHLFFEGRNDF